MKKRVHLIGNAHLDPVWLWRFQEGFAEIKATFRSALDRITEFDDFIFTTACASYYQWVEESCPDMFEEIREAVKAGKWSIVGGMWIQPDCNMPSAESFARHFLYSQRYFEEKFGVIARTGYNVDSFGHSAALPKLLKLGGIDNYVFMRPGTDEEKIYPFFERAFRWQNDGSEVLTYRLPMPYCINFKDDETLKEFDDATDSLPHTQMIFYGVGNHGGGPTVTNINIIHEFQKHAKNEFLFSSCDAAFEEIRRKDFGKLPVYRGELQNHASGCYSANSAIKKLNRAGENRLGEAERMEMLAAHCMGFKADPAKNAEAWQYVLFNQFHDILCGCSIKSAYDDAYAFGGAAVTRGVTLCNAAMQKLSWAIDTSKGVTLSKEMNSRVWERDDLGTPVVVFNPLSHSAKIPVFLPLPKEICAAVTDENDRPIPFQIVRDKKSGSPTQRACIHFCEEIPALGWKTFWVYLHREFERPHAPVLIAEKTCLSNNQITVTFDPETGNIASMCTADGRNILGKNGVRTLVIDDFENDTWAHSHFVFDKLLGEFAGAEFCKPECGDVCASLKVVQHYKTSKLEQIYTLYPDDPKLYVQAKLTLCEPTAMIKLAVDTGILGGRWIREAAAGIIEAPQDGREMPMQRFELVEKDGLGAALLNDSKYSASCKDGEMRMVMARSCFYADHCGPCDARDWHTELQDIGEHTFSWTLMPYDGDMAKVFTAAEELNTAFPMVAETYHRGTLPQHACYCTAMPENVTVTAIKSAEDGNGFIVRLLETAGRTTAVNTAILGHTIRAELQPWEIRCFRLADAVTECDFLEKTV